MTESVFEFEEEEEFIPAMEHGDFSFNGYQLVGHGEKTNEFCGRFIHLKGCLSVEKHNVTTLDGENYAGKIFRRKVHNHCDKPSCPTCYREGWSYRLARKAEARLNEASRRGLGSIEHLMISVPKRDYHLDITPMRAKVNRLLRERGVIAGALLFHGGRFDKRRFFWVYSPHFHVLGIVLGGYSKCRNCKRKWNCDPSCNRLDARLWKAYQADGYYVRVFEKRKSIFKTLTYLLGHATIKVGVKGFRVLTYFGAISYRKLKVTAELRKALCPICHDELIRIVYSGRKAIIMVKDAPDYKRDSVEPFKENGVSVYSEYVKE